MSARADIDTLGNKWLELVGRSRFRFDAGIG
jgi:hypothetical protein